MIEKLTSFIKEGKAKEEQLEKEAAELRAELEGKTKEEQLEVLGGLPGSEHWEESTRAYG